MDSMTFWIVASLLALAVVAILLRGAARARLDTDPVAAYDVKVYRDQLNEVDRDLARGIVNPEDAERTKTEIARRILAADAEKHQQKDAQHADVGNETPTWTSKGLIGIVIVGGSLWIYTQLGAPGYGDLALKDRIETAELLRANRPSQAEAEASLSPTDIATPAAPAPEYAALVEQLRTVVENRPDDLRGLRLLAISERNLGNFSAAHSAFGRYLDLRGEDATPQEFADLADMYVLAAGGYVSPEAEAALAIALRGDPSNGPARYFQGVMLAQTGRPDQAFQIWDHLLRAGPAEAPWIPLIQSQIDEMAFRAGIRYTQPVPGSARGPSAADIDAAGDMSASERIEMIEGMVAGLAERLSSEGGTVDDWARLITSLTVLDRRNDAFSVYQNAIQVFADDPAAMDIINRAGEQAGVAN